MKLHIDSEVTSVAQKMYTIPLGLRIKVIDKLDELESLDVIGKAEGPLLLVSPVVVEPKLEHKALCRYETGQQSHYQRMSPDTNR